MSQESGTAPSSGTDLRELVAVLRHRKVAVIGTALLITFSALVTSLLLTPIYASEARVLVETPVFDPGELATPTEPDMETEVQLAQSPAVASLVADALGSDVDVRTLLDELSTSRETDTRIIVFRYANPDPAVAMDRAQAFADGYLEFRRQQVLDDLVAASESIQRRIASLEEELVLVDEELAATADSTLVLELEREAESLNFQISALKQQLGNLAPPDNLGVGLVVEPAQLPLEAASPNHLLNAIFAVIIGIGLGIGLALLRERLDARLRGHADLETRLGSPVLAVVPRFSRQKGQLPSDLVVLSNPNSAAAEAYRTLKTGLLFAAQQRAASVILVTSPSSGEGKTATAANLAVVLAQGGKRVVLVSADLRKPRIHEMFDVPRQPGLTTLLTEQTDLHRASRRTSVGGLRVIPSGETSPAPGDLLSSDAMGELMTRLTNVSDFVILDCPPLLPVSDALMLAPSVDAVLFIADASKTAGSDVDYARERLEQVDTPIIGAVFNNYDPSRSGHPYRYSYEAYYAPLPSRGNKRKTKEETPEQGEASPSDLSRKDQPPRTSPPPTWEDDEGLGGGFLQSGPTIRKASSD